MSDIGAPSRADPRDMIFWPSSNPPGSAGWTAIAQLQREVATTGALGHLQIKDVSGTNWFWSGYTLIPTALLLYEFAQRQSSPSGTHPFAHMKLVALNPIDQLAFPIETPEDVVLSLTVGAQPAIWMGHAPTKEAMARKQRLWHERKRTEYEALALQARMSVAPVLPASPYQRHWQEIIGASRQVSDGVPYVNVQGPRLHDATGLIWAGYTVISPDIMLAEFGARIAKPDLHAPLRERTLLALDPYEQQAQIVRSAADYVSGLAHDSIFAIYLPGPEHTRTVMRDAQNRLVRDLLLRLMQLTGATTTKQ